MLKVIVTGATGFIGKHLCEKLLSEGVTVYGIGRNRKILEALSENPKFVGIELDFSEYEELDKRIRDRDFDCFFHLANFGVNGPDKQDYKIQICNLSIACDAVKLAHTFGCKRFIFAGSVDEYEAIYQPDKEFVAPTHSRIYGIAKYSAECIGKVMANSMGMEYVTALLALTYGEGNNTKILPNVIMRNSLENKPINLIEGNNYYDMIYIDEAVDGIVAIANKGKSMESYYIGHEHLKTFRENVERINDLMDRKIELKFGYYQNDGQIFDYEKIDRGKLERDTGYKCNYDFDVSISNTYKWIKSMYS